MNSLAVHLVHTLFHEIGRAVLSDSLPLARDEYDLHNSITEFRTETAAYLTLSELGLHPEEMATHGRGYIRHRLSGKRLRQEAIRAVSISRMQFCKLDASLELASLTAV